MERGRGREGEERRERDIHCLSLHSRTVMRIPWPVSEGCDIRLSPPPCPSPLPPPPGVCRCDCKLVFRSGSAVPCVRGPGPSIITETGAPAHPEHPQGEPHPLHRIQVMVAPGNGNVNVPRAARTHPSGETSRPGGFERHADRITQPPHPPPPPPSITKISSVPPPPPLP